MSDRPWGAILGALGLTGDSGVLTVTGSDRKAFRIVLAEDGVVEASSPATADTIARVALTAKLLPAAHAAEIAKRQTKAPNRDELAIVAEVAHLTHGETERLRHRAIVQRVARTFELDGATFQFERQMTRSGRTVGVDIREIIYEGARRHLSDPRMFEDLRVLGSRFELTDGGRTTLDRFGFGELEAPILAALECGTSLAEIEAVHRDIDPRTARAVIYALACCRAIEPGRATQLAKPRTTTETFAEQQNTTVAPSRSLSHPEIETMIADRCSLIDAGRDLFAVLGLETGASIEAVRSAYLELVRYIHPDKLAMFGIAETADSQRLYAQAGVAYSTLSDPTHRASYLGPEGALEPAAAATDDMAGRAQDAYLRGTRLLDADRPDAAVTELAKACELAPGEVDYRATLAWAAFCAAPDKSRIGPATRKALERAIVKSDHPLLARAYLGRVERMLGHDLEALNQFREVLALAPDHVEAKAEIRIIEARLARGTKRSIR